MLSLYDVPPGLRIGEDAFHFGFYDLLRVSNDAQIVFFERFRSYRLNDWELLLVGSGRRRLPELCMESFEFHLLARVVGGYADEFAGGELREGGRCDGTFRIFRLTHGTVETVDRNRGFEEDVFVEPVADSPRCFPRDLSADEVARGC